MIVYSVTVMVEAGLADEWMQWMRDVHIPDVLATGYFTGHRLQRLVFPEPDEGQQTFNIQYFCESYEAYNCYQKEQAPRLQAEHNARYKDRFVAFRTLLEDLSVEAPH
ncbi:MAG: DUF4286 family protein [Bacteroidetes bacterium]|jgi:hypothetical protein|nr:DUF4286 family protein [Bacteroidota bacterium]